MNYFIIDRVEGAFAICIDDACNRFEKKIEELPVPVMEGMAFRDTEQGCERDAGLEAALRRRAAEKQKEVFHRGE